MRRQRGFTLIEVIVAFALLAGALTLLVGALSNASRQIRHADDAGRVALHAQSLLATVGVGEPLQPGSREGEFDAGRYRWNLQVSPFADPARAAATGPAEVAATQLLQLDLQVQWGEKPGERLQWRTLRLIPPGAPQ